MSFAVGGNSLPWSLSRRYLEHSHLEDHDRANGHIAHEHWEEESAFEKFMFAHELHPGRLDGMSIIYLSIIGMHTIIVLLLSLLYVKHRHAQAIHIRGPVQVPLMTVWYVHLVVCVTWATYSMGLLRAGCSYQFVIACIFLPTGLAILNIHGSTVQDVKTMQQSILHGRNPAEPYVKQKRTWFRPFVELTVRARGTLLFRITIVVATIATLIIVLGNRKFHEGFGFFDGSSDPSYRGSGTCLDGLEWSIAMWMQSFWTLWFSVYLLWKIRAIQDLFMWATQVRWIAAVQIIGPCLFIVIKNLEAEGPHSINDYFPPVNWVAPGLMFGEYAILLFPLCNSKQQPFSTALRPIGRKLSILSPMPLANYIRRKFRKRDSYHDLPFSTDGSIQGSITDPKRMRVHYADGRPSAPATKRQIFNWVLEKDFVNFYKFCTINNRLLIGDSLVFLDRAREFKMHFEDGQISDALPPLRPNTRKTRLRTAAPNLSRPISTASQTTDGPPPSTSDDVTPLSPSKQYFAKSAEMSGHDPYSSTESIAPTAKDPGSASRITFEDVEKGEIRPRDFELSAQPTPHNIEFKLTMPTPIPSIVTKPSTNTLYRTSSKLEITKTDKVGNLRRLFKRAALIYFCLVHPSASTSINVPFAVLAALEKIFGHLEHRAEDKTTVLIEAARPPTGQNGNSAPPATPLRHRPTTAGGGAPKDRSEVAPWATPFVPSVPSVGIRSGDGAQPRDTKPRDRSSTAANRPLDREDESFIDESGIEMQSMVPAQSTNDMSVLFSPIPGSANSTPRRGQVDNSEISELDNSTMHLNPAQPRPSATSSTTPPLSPYPAPNTQPCIFGIVTGANGTPVTVAEDFDAAVFDEAVQHVREMLFLNGAGERFGKWKRGEDKREKKNRGKLLRKEEHRKMVTGLEALGWG